ncbi:hypothetical protein [Mesorhizobium sp. LNJC403B00]|uniref:hypothetical protein n=1 Tax=Mesorhizobium sp. LNJC403B00 TaxID=1287280 RepID=UPI0003CF4965|nr:hypothetical protein [Mesorhizobium sp. LNJC403B00]ESX88270.1 hypothetical protein X754_26985 [Mesorhizobium sp. LNJC403B00]
MFRFELGTRGLLQELADDVAALVLAHEKRSGSRKRQRRPGDAKAFNSAVMTIVANLAHYALFPPEQGRITLPLGHRRRASAGRGVDGFGKALSALLGTLEAVGVAAVIKPQEAGYATTIAPTAAFTGEVNSRGIGGLDFVRKTDLPALVLTQKDQWGRREPVVVPNTDEAASKQAQVRRFNERLAVADVAYVGNQPTDIHDRKLVRRFTLPRGAKTPELRYSGRLFGGFWQQMRRTERRHIRIGGERIGELDYRQMFPRLAYARIGASPPEGSPYELPGMEEFTYEEKKAVKSAFNAFLFKATTMRKWHPDIEHGLPQGWTVGRFKQALLKKHPRLAPVLNRGIGYELMYAESEILCGVLERTLDRGDAALPLHDAVLIPATRISHAKEIMMEEAFRVAGARIDVAMKSHS